MNSAERTLSNPYEVSAENRNSEGAMPNASDQSASVELVNVRDAFFRLALYQYITAGSLLVWTCLGLVVAVLPLRGNAFVISTQLQLILLICGILVFLVFSVPSALIFLAARSARKGSGNLIADIEQACLAQTLFWKYVSVLYLIVGFAVFFISI